MLQPISELAKEKVEGAWIHCQSFLLKCLDISDPNPYQKALPETNKTIFLPLFFFNSCIVFSSGIIKIEYLALNSFTVFKCLFAPKISSDSFKALIANLFKVLVSS